MVAIVIVPYRSSRVLACRRSPATLRMCSVDSVRNPGNSDQWQADLESHLASCRVLNAGIDDEPVVRERIDFIAKTCDNIT